MDQFKNSTAWIEETAGNGSFQLSYRIVATGLHLVIFIMGILGNSILIVAVCKSKTLHTPGNAYLVSLASADLLVIGIAVPEAIVSHQIGTLWLLGKPGCAIFVFLNFLGINAGSLSLFAFTVERYVAVCRPMLAQKICTLERTRKIIALCWMIAFAYCAPWLGLTEVRQNSDGYQCELRLTKEVYEVIFAIDLILFYLIPLMVAVVCHAKIVTVLKKREQLFSSLHKGYSQHDYDTSDDGLHHVYQHSGDHIIIHHSNSNQDPGSAHKEQTQRLRMLIVIVLIFAVSWLPFRGLLVYNTFAKEPWLDLWYMLFAKTLIYLNCAINPFLYNVLCHGIRRAVLKTVSRNLCLFRR